MAVAPQIGRNPWDGPSQNTRNINHDPFFMVVFLQGTPIFSQNCHLYFSHFHHPASPFHSLEEASSAVVPLLDLWNASARWFPTPGCLGKTFLEQQPTRWNEKSLLPQAEKNYVLGYLGNYCHKVFEVKEFPPKTQFVFVEALPNA